MGEDRLVAIFAHAAGAGRERDGFELPRRAEQREDGDVVEAVEGRLAR